MTSGWNRKGHEIRRVKGAGVLLSLLLFGALAEGQESPALVEPPQQTIRVNVNRVDVGVIVTNAKGEFVEGLQRDDFAIFDDGNPQAVTDFASIDAPAQVLLLLEAGPAVYMLEDSHLYVASALLANLAAGDRVAIAAYNETPTPILDYTTDKHMAEGALDQIHFNLGFGNLNLATSLNAVLDWLGRLPGKKTIVLVSSGVDTSPPEAMQAVLRRLETGDVMILAVSMSGPLRNGKKGTKQQIAQTEEAFAQADAWLKALSGATGGRAYFPENAKAFQEAYRQMANLVRHEYSLAFAPPKADGGTHAIEVKVKGGAETKNGTPVFRVEHRQGYVAPKAGE